jgi:hypothetical protein
MKILHILKDILPNAVSITALVMVMLLLVEFINVSSSGKWMKKLQNKPLLQIIVAGIIGLIPGCLGGFTVISLFTHKMLFFPALIAGMISSFGDEVFVLFAFSPATALLMAVILLFVGIMSGMILAKFYKKKTEIGHDLKLHSDCDLYHDDCHHAHSSKILSIKNIKNISFPRAILLFGIMTYLFLLFSGTFSHQHTVIPDFSSSSQTVETEHHAVSCMDENCNSHELHHEKSSHHTFSWENILFAILALMVLFITAFTSNHFLNEHLWAHVLKQHFLSVFLWTFGVLLGMHLLFYFVDLNAFITAHHWSLLIVLLLALLIGIIPESGPHIIFIVLYFNGIIPFSILLANFIVQDGHSALPLIAESRMNFVWMKFIKITIGLLVGLLGFFLHI